MRDELKYRPTVAPALRRFAGTFVYGLCLSLAVLVLPVDDGGSAVPVLAALGVIGIWRYGWWGVHIIRATLYSAVHFPRSRAAADRLGKRVDHLYVVVTSYRMEPGISWPVYEALVRDVVEYGAPTTIVAAVGDQGDEELLRHLMETVRPPENVELVIMFQDGTGKRSALAEGLRAISRRMPTANSALVLMDGDVRLPAGTLGRSLPFFGSMPHLGALTTDNRGITAGPNWAKEWYDLRFAQRHLLMRSMAMSQKLLVLTGRFSVFRGEIATRADFIAAVEEDSIEHWRLGRVRLVTGDDKSTWFWLLRNGWAMTYLPDVQVHSFERLPSSSFLRGSTQLMIRWFGNSLRASSRAIALGPRRLGFFTWWSLVDQRLSMWTALVGPVFAISFAVAHSVDGLLAYAAWVMVTRLVGATAIGLQRGRFSPYFPVLLYYSQIAGALIKTYVSFRLNRQKWTRQGIIGIEGADRRTVRMQRLVASSLHIFAMVAFVTAVAVAGGLVPMVDRLSLSKVIAPAEAGQDQSFWIQNAIDQAMPGSTVRLPAGEIRLERPLRIARDEVTLAGEGPDKTTLIATFPGSDIGVIEIVGELPRDIPKNAACGKLAAPAVVGDRSIQLAAEVPFTRGGFVSLRAGNDPAYLDAIGTQRWRREQPMLRQALAGVEGRQRNVVTLDASLETAFPAGTEACPIALRRNVTVRDLTIRYDIGPSPRPDLYENTQPAAAVDGIAIHGAADPELSDIRVIDAGRHPINLDTVLKPRLHRVSATGSHNKGDGGNGYFRIARTYDGRFDDITLRGLRHLAIQWSSAGNRIDGLDSDSDVNFHGGQTHDNVVRVRRLSPRAGHPWPPVSRTPVDAGWAPPDGPNNRVFDDAGRELVNTPS